MSSETGTFLNFILNAEGKKIYSEMNNVLCKVKIQGNIIL